MRKPDRPKTTPGQPLPLREWEVKLRGIDEPLIVHAEYRAAARHYAKSYAPDELQPMIQGKGDIYFEVEWCRLKKPDEGIPF